MNGINGHSSPVATNEELDAMRTQEVLDKAVTGSLVLILKWFKVSRKFLRCNAFTYLLIISHRHSEVRVHHTTTRGLKLRTVDLEAVTVTRDREDC
jgi:hypothetical protein